MVASIPEAGHRPRIVAIADWSHIWFIQVVWYAYFNLLNWNKLYPTRHNALSKRPLCIPVSNAYLVGPPGLNAGTKHPCSSEHPLNLAATLLGTA